MGKKAKEHRAKVAKRNVKLVQQKSAMQKAFDMLMKAQIEQLQNNENIKAEINGQELGFEIIDKKEPENTIQLKINEQESAKINKEFEPEYDSAGYTIEDRELPTEE